MKKIINISIFMAALILASSCQDESGLNPIRKVTMDADMAQTKTLLDGNAVKWESTDKVALVLPHTSSSAAVETFSTAITTPAVTAKFSGALAAEVTRANGYADNGFAVYPASSVTAAGVVNHTLPSEQTPLASGSFASGLNLMSASVSLSDIEDDSNTSASFLNALSVIRFSVTGSDVVSVTLEGTSPLAGMAPVVLDESTGRLAVNASGSWSSASNSVTLKPSSGCLAEGTVFNLLVWPGTHTSMTLTMNFSEYGAYEKKSVKAFTFEPAKYYTFDLNADSETLVTEITDGLSSVEGDLTTSEDKLGELEADAARLSVLLSQIQSVTLLSEYLEDVVYAPYANIGSSKEKKEVELEYIIRPASVAAELVKNYSSVFSAQLYYADGDKTFSTLAVNSVALDGDILTVKVAGTGISDAFYNGNADARLALQISDGNTNVLSDFAKLMPQVQSAIRLNYQTDVPAVPGASVSIPFTYALAEGDSHSFTYSSNASVRDNGGSGYFIVNISEDTPVADQTAKLSLTVGSTTTDYDFTFVEAGRIEITTDAPVDYIGGEVVATVTRNDLASGPLTLTSGASWCTQNGMIFDCAANSSSSSRTATADYKVTYRGLTYTKTVKILQYGTSTGLQRSYYSNGSKVMLNTASPVYNPLNIVILGDGFQKKDLSTGGKFERIAASACQTFFSIEPFASYKDRFNVYMVAYESTDEGIDINSSGTTKDTYFGAWCTGGGNTAANCDNSTVINVVKNVVGLSSDAQYYRTVVIVLANTSENVGSCAYPTQTTISTSTVGDGYASFAIATLAAYSTGTNGLIKHEVGGHAFGRLGDEYNTGSADRSPTTLANSHNIGFYLNLSSSSSSFPFPWSELNGYDGTSAYEGAWGCATGYYRPSQSSIMLNNQGEFNAPSRAAIHRRIILQSEYNASWSVSKFKEYDTKNL